MSLRSAPGDAPAEAPRQEPPAEGAVAGLLDRWSGPVLLVGLIVWMVQLTLVDGAPGRFAASQEAAASPLGRVFAALVLLAAVHHGLCGVVRGLRPRGAVASARADAAVRFATWALVVPGWVILARPWVEGWLP